jgi:glycosyltransferase involved in cell wall biosynthesis
MLLPIGFRFADQDKFEYQYAYFLEDKHDLEPLLKEQNAAVHCFGAKGNLDLLLKIAQLRRFLKDRQIDLIHAHLPLAGVAARLAAAPLGIPVVYTEHNLMERYHPVTRALNRSTFKKQAVAVAVSDDVANSIKRQIGEAANVITVANGIDTQSFRKNTAGGLRARAGLGIPADAPVAGLVAVFREQKQLPLWLDVAEKVLEDLPDAYFILAGDGPLMPLVKERATSGVLASRLKLPGLIKDQVQDYYSAMDVFFMSSRFEGLPLALLEAMACECAVVATSVGGVAEVVKEGETGRLLKHDDAQGMHQALVEALGNKAMAKAQGLIARKVVEEHFSISRMTAELEQIYLGVLGNCQSKKNG